jgi:predicted secreted protein
MNLIVETWNSDGSVKLDSYFGITAEKYNEIAREHKVRFLNGKYKTFEHTMFGMENRPDSIVIELPPEVQE